MRYGGKQSGGGGSFEQPPLGSMSAVLAAIYDVGFQADFDKTKPPKHKLALVWELSARTSKGVPFVIIEKVNVSSNEKSVLADRFASLNGRPPTEQECMEGFDDSMMVGKTCIVKVMRNATNPNGKAYIKSTSDLISGMPNLRVEGDYRTPPKLVEWLMEHQVPPPAKTATTPSREPGDDTDEIAAEKRGGSPF